MNTHGYEASGVAPFESCVGCYKGDTNTVVGFRGDAEWAIILLNKLCGLPMEQAEGAFDVWSQEKYGTDPGTVPTGEVVFVARLCEDCAAATGARITRLPPGQDPVEVFTYQQPDRLKL